MRRRLYFVLPDLGSAIRTSNDLLLARIEDRYMHFLAKRGTSLGELNEANVFQKSDLRHSMQLGFMFGGWVRTCTRATRCCGTRWPRCR